MRNGHDEHPYETLDNLPPIKENDGCGLTILVFTVGLLILSVGVVSVFYLIRSLF